MIQTYIENYQVYLALKYGLITYQDLLNYLVDKPGNEQNIIAYRHFLLHVQEIGDKPEYHCIEDDHFLTLVEDDDYSVVYALMGFPLDIPTEDDEDPALYFCRGTIKLYTNPGFKAFIDLILDPETSTWGFVPEQTELHLKARNIKQYTIHGIDASFLPSIVKYHLFPLLREDMGTLDNIIQDTIMDSLKQVSEKQPELWKYLSPEYIKILKFLYEKGKVVYREKDHQTIVALFPNLFPEEMVKNFTTLAWKLYHLPLIIQGYFLGYHLYITPSRKDLHPALMLLSKEGVDGYVEKYIQERKDWFEKWISIQTSTIFANYKYELVNTINTLQEDIFSYPAFDIMFLHEGEGKCFAFTAEEFSSLLQGKHNFYTQNIISKEHCSNLQYYLNFRSEHNLPPSKTVIELLKNEVDEYICSSQDRIISYNPSQTEIRAQREHRGRRIVAPGYTQGQMGQQGYGYI